MQKNPLVSILIPAYNRAHIISETLDTILEQTYKNWECIIVDDGSDDDTEKVVQAYVDRDSRFQLYSRPKDRLRGGNAARNYAFELSKGEYIQWFDSDDLMTPDKLQLKVETILKYDVDFVVSKTKFYNRPNHKGYAYDFVEEDVTFLSYSTSFVNWFTYDLFFNRRCLSHVSFNETIRAGQEYNFSCKLLLETTSVKKIDKFLTLRRFHDTSIGRARQLDKMHYWKTIYDLHWETLNELASIKKLPVEYIEYAMLKCTRALIENNKIRSSLVFHKKLIITFKVKVIYYYLATLSKRLFNKYDYFYSKFKKIK